MIPNFVALVKNEKIIITIATRLVYIIIHNALWHQNYVDTPVVTNRHFRSTPILNNSRDNWNFCQVLSIYNKITPSVREM